MKVCLDCGAPFEEDHVKRWTEPHGEPMTGSPCCYGAFDAAERCENCGGDFQQETLFCGLCEKCLRDSITYDTALQFLMDTEDYFNLFMFEAWYDSSAPDTVSDKLRDMMVMQFKREKAEEILLGKHDFIEALRKFILDGDGDCGKETYAKWLRRLRLS